MPKKDTSKYFTHQQAHGASSKFGQMIGDAFDDVVIEFIKGYLEEQYPDYVLLQPQIGKLLLRLETIGGTVRQLDNVIAPIDSRDPVALFETKWLKDGRHHNDKGAWILQLKEVKKKYPTIRGAAAILAGYWTEGVALMFRSEAGVKMVLVATDEQVYSTLQEPINKILTSRNLPEFTFNVKEIRDSLPRSWDLANALIDLGSSGELASIATSWLNFQRDVDENGVPLLGSDAIKKAIDSLIGKLPENPSIHKFEIGLQIDTGNMIYQEFIDVEDVIAFLQEHFMNPASILNKITPKKNKPVQPNLFDAPSTED